MKICKTSSDLIIFVSITSMSNGRIINFLDVFKSLLSHKSWDDEFDKSIQPAVWNGQKFVNGSNYYVYKSIFSDTKGGIRLASSSQVNSFLYVEECFFNNIYYLTENGGAIHFLNGYGVALKKLCGYNCSCGSNWGQFCMCDTQNSQSCKNIIYFSSVLCSNGIHGSATTANYHGDIKITHNNHSKNFVSNRCGFRIEFANTKAFASFTNV